MKTQQNKTERIHCFCCDKYYDLNITNTSEMIDLGWKIITINYEETYYICPEHKFYLRDFI
jgi:hypothetical protein